MEKDESEGEEPIIIGNEEEENEEDEAGDMIADLKETPKLYEIPKPKDSQLKSKKYEPIEWQKAFPNSTCLNNEIPIYWKGEQGPNIVCLHGAGHSGLSFAPLALIAKKFRVISFDFRGHGFNTMSNGEDLSLVTLISDTIRVLNYVSTTYPEENIIVMGHSMGGSIATKTCAHILSQKDKYKDLYEKIQGLICIDVVEGTAMEALPFMENIVYERPPSFSTLEKGIEYMFKSGTIKNIESARISVPPLLKKVDKQSGSIYEWKTNLLASKKYWTEWFIGLTKAFLSCKVPKILMLAGIERMDKDLTIAQMQGKFQLSVVPEVGHVIQEDDPAKTLKIIEDFLHTFKIGAKLSDMKPIIGKLGHATITIDTVKYEEYQQAK